MSAINIVSKIIRKIEESPDYTKELAINQIKFIEMDWLESFELKKKEQLER